MICRSFAIVMSSQERQKVSIILAPSQQLYHMLAVHMHNQKLRKAKTHKIRNSSFLNKITSVLQVTTYLNLSGLQLVTFFKEVYWELVGL